jgi:hypothetical protein
MQFVPFLAAVCALLASCCFSGAQAAGLHPPHQAFRVVVTTDGEIDDLKSMVRCFSYTNEGDVRELSNPSSAVAGRRSVFQP